MGNILYVDLTSGEFEIERVELEVALALVDKASTLGRRGLGAVMGSKKLKAIIASGGKHPNVYAPN